MFPYQSLVGNEVVLSEVRVCTIGDPCQGLGDEEFVVELKLK